MSQQPPPDPRKRPVGRTVLPILVLLVLLLLAVVPTELGRDEAGDGPTSTVSDPASVATTVDEAAPTTTLAEPSATEAGPSTSSLATTTTATTSRRFDTITVAVPSAVTTFDPNAAASGRDLDMLANLYSGLTRRVLEASAVVPGLYRWSLTEVEPDLAESIDVSEDGKVYTFRIRRDLEFPSGHALKARDFAYAWERALALAAGDAPPGPTATGLAAAGISSMAQVEVVEDHTLRVTLVRPNPRVLRVMAMGVMSAVDSILLRSQATEADPWATAYAERNPSGYGPHVLVEREGAGQMALEPYDGWWDPKTAGRSRIAYRPVFGEAARLQLVRDGAVDLAHGMPTVTVEEAGNEARVVSLESASQRYLVFDRREPPFDDPRVRQAVALALDYDRIEGSVYAGRARIPTGFIPAGVEGSVGSWPYMQDIDQARKLLAEAGYADGFGAELLVPLNLPEGEALAARIRGDLELIGIDLKPWPIQAGHLPGTMQLSGVAFDMALVACDLWLPEVWYVSRTLAQATPPCPTSYRHPEAEQLLDEMEGQPTTAAAVLAERIQEIWADEAAFVPVSNPEQIDVLGEDISGFVLTNEGDALYFPLLHRTD